jgi:hypothetical protein
MKKITVFCSLIFFLIIPVKAPTAPLTPCTVIAYANANTYIQGPSYSVSLGFEGSPTPTPVSLSGCPGVTTATIIVANPPQNPPPTAPVYMSLNGAASGTNQLLLMQGTTVITQADFPGWFSTATSYTGVTVTCPSTPWVPSSITIIWQ